MLNSLPICLVVGTVLGFLTGLGIGGGSLLMLWLTLVLGVSQDEARQINLLFFLPSALISCWMHKKQGTLNWKTSLPGMISGCAAAGLGSWIAADRRCAGAVLSAQIGQIALQNQGSGYRIHGVFPLFPVVIVLGEDIMRLHRGAPLVPHGNFQAGGLP